MRAEKNRKTRKKLIDQGIEIICKEGIKNFSIRRVAKECGMSPKGPYNYFEDANDFMNEIRHRILRGMMARLYSDEVLREKAPWNGWSGWRKPTIPTTGNISIC